MARKKIETLAKKIRIAAIDESCVLKAVNNKSISDFEDGLEYYAAEQSKCHCIITEDVSDFFFSKLEVIRTKDFVEKYLLT